MVMSKYFWILGSIIFVFLGLIHLFYTFFSNKFSPRNQSLESEMKLTNLVLTKETTIWKAWIGFNASHSSGTMFIGFLNLYLALKYFSVLQTDHLFFLFNIFTVGFYVWLAKKYWFKVPFTGITITLLCFIISYILILINN
jgi:hypothetical protein